LERLANLKRNGKNTEEIWPEPDEKSIVENVLNDDPIDSKKVIEDENAVVDFFGLENEKENKSEQFDDAVDIIEDNYPESIKGL